MHAKMWSMKTLSLQAWLCWFLVITASNAQTPPNYSPSTPNKIDVTFNGDLQVHPGKSLRPSDTQMTPTLSSKYLNIFDRYVAFVMDKEIAHSGVGYPLLHWYQPDMRVEDTTNGDFILRNTTDTGAYYVGPQPNPGPSHEYVVLVFKQPKGYQFPKCFESIFPISVETRAGFDLHYFMEQTGLDDLVAANYFKAANPTKPTKRPSPVTSTSLSKAPCATKTWAFHGDL